MSCAGARGGRRIRGHRLEEDYRGFTLIAAPVRGVWQAAIADGGRQLWKCNGPDADAVFAELRKYIDQNERFALRYPEDKATYKGLELVCAQFSQEWVGHVRDEEEVLVRRVGADRESVVLELKRAVDESENLMLRHPLDVRPHNSFSIRTIEKGSKYQSFAYYRDERVAGGELGRSVGDACNNLIRRIDGDPNIIEAVLSRNHNRMLAAAGVANADHIGFHPRNAGRSERFAHCWACHHPIDNLHFHECDGCGWIICFCGACGCSYQGLRSS